VAKVKKFSKNIIGKNIIITDDIIDTAGTITAACQELKNHQVANIYLFITHGILSGPAIKRLRQSAVKELIITDTYPLDREKKINKIKILSITPLLKSYLK